jgi:alkanesulfonate monooxygenase SsuD/methylene tetrahydromethanopterin reductase-like flavin-dependent oxidoreductase (luciferase family)
VKIDVQLSPAVEAWPSLRSGVLVAEEAGFDCAWVFDHFAGDMLRGTTMLECFTLLGALAATTERIGLGSLVANVNNRPAGVLAAGAASVQTISGGRFVLGLGAGAAPGGRWSEEHRALGMELGSTIAERHARLQSTLDLVDRLWAEDREPELATFARPDPRPPIILGVNSEALAAVAGRRCDGINVRGDHAELEPILRAAAQARLASGRAEHPWDVSVWSMWDARLFDPMHPEMRRWSALGVTRVVMVFLEPHDPSALRDAAEAVRRLGA